MKYIKVNPLYGSVGIIGGADGPTAIFVGKSDTGLSETVLGISIGVLVLAAVIAGAVLLIKCIKNEK